MWHGLMERYLMKMRLRLNHFDPEGPLDKIPASEICSEESVHNVFLRTAFLLSNFAHGISIEIAAGIRGIWSLGAGIV